MDKQTAKRDRQAIEQLARAIVDNKRLAWEVVDLWLKQNDTVLLPHPQEWYLIPRGAILRAAEGISDLANLIQDNKLTLEAVKARLAELGKGEGDETGAT